MAPVRSLNVLFAPESAYGPTNNCVGIARRLAARGHRVTFAAERSWAGRLEPLGFTEELIDLSPPDPGAQDPGQFWKDYINAIAPAFATSTAEQLTSVIRPIFEELIAGVRYSAEQYAEAVARSRPDVIVEDNVVAFPALMNTPTPFVRIVSCNPLEVPSQGVAPAFSGLAEGDLEGFAAFREEFGRTHGETWGEFNEYVISQGAPALPELEFMGPGLSNLYVYPEELDYARELGESWHRVESSVRENEAEVKLPEGFADGSRKVVYFSLGSLGSADVSLMRRVIAALAETPYDVIVSKGPRHEEIELAENMWGAEFVPQTTLLQRADVVITHGGNNTVTESMHFSKPMVVLPLFWDQYDNAQRVDERGFGRRLATYEFSAEELRRTLDELLADHALAKRCAAAGARIRATDGLGHAATIIEAAAG